MREPQHHSAEDERLDTVLSALRTALPEEGFEQRLARRLADVPAREVRAHRLWPGLPARLILAGSGVAALVLVTVLGLKLVGHTVSFHAGSSGTPAAQTARKEQNAAQSTPGERAALAVSSNGAVASSESTWAQLVEDRAKIALARQDSRNEHVRRVSETKLRKISSDSPTVLSSRQASFPAPPMPLTEQERLLLRIAHRNDPVEVAMLDPVSRDVQRAHDRAEFNRFFTPPALPPDLQQQIRAAVRSQYVNTPPPDDEVLNDHKKRSIP